MSSLRVILAPMTTRPPAEVAKPTGPGHEDPEVVSMVLDMRLKGYATAEIARVTRIPEDHIIGIISRGLARDISWRQNRDDELRAMERRRLDMLMASMEPAFTKTIEVNGRHLPVPPEPAMVVAFLRLSERRAKLEGIDLPPVKPTGDVDDAQARIRAALAEMAKVSNA